MPPVSRAYARAESESPFTLTGAYAYIPTAHVYLYSDSADPTLRHGLFRLPHTYYVRILSEESDYYRVEYLSDGEHTKRVTGYCKKNEIIPVDYTPTAPYLYKTITVTYRLDNDPGGSLSSLTLTCAYYGDYTDGTKSYCYVLLGDSFGYVPRPADLTFDKNPEYEARLPDDEPTETPATDTPASPARIIVLLLVCLLVPLLAALIFRHGTRRPFEEDIFD